jgi:hypothetical protein
VQIPSQASKELQNGGRLGSMIDSISTLPVLFSTAIEIVSL